MCQRLNSYLLVPFLLLFNIILNAQETCVTAISLSLGNTINADNFGSIPDINYSAQTNCASTYSSSVWYSFTVPSGVGSLNVTFTSTGIGSSATITIVDDCTSASSSTYYWFDCDANSISGVQNSLCNLSPNTTYYIQISSDVADEGTFQLLYEINPNSPINDICESATPIFGDGIADCDDFSFFINPDVSGACPDDQASNICMTDTDPGVWYQFTIPDPTPFNFISINPVGSNFDLFVSTTGCDNLTYVDCLGYIFLVVEPGATYYLLTNDNITFSVGTNFDTNCGNPDQDANTGSGVGGTYFGLNSCATGSDDVPCMNDAVSWLEYTTGCNISDITISLDPWQTAVGGQLTDGSISVFSDCNTLLTDYDPNGLGYICSGIINNEDLILNDVPPGTNFVIAIGSDYNYTGYYAVNIIEESNGNSVPFDDCSTAGTVFDGLSLDLTNECATMDLDVEGCPNNSQATVWFEYTCPPGNHDVTIDVIPNGIGSPSIAIYEDCNSTMIETICNTTLDLECVSGTLLIQIGSSAVNTGSFDLDIVATSTGTISGIEASPSLICSGESTDLLITIQGGIVGDIIVNVDASSDPNIEGEQMHLFSNVNSAILDDILINNNSTIANAVYSIDIVADGYSCPAGPFEIIIPVNPKFTITNETIEVCQPEAIGYNAADLLSGGTLPYTSFEWYWNGIDLISSTDMFDNYFVSNDGFISLQVTDDNGCTAEATIDVIAHPEIIPVLSVDYSEACQGNPEEIIFAATLNVGQVAQTGEWEIFDENMALVNTGFAVGPEFYFMQTVNLDPGSYSIQVTITDIYGCIGTSNILSFEIFPSPIGEIIIQQENCEAELLYFFYGLDGSDIFGHGLDSNLDGIPDIFDLDNDGNHDFSSITWISPSNSIFQTNELSFTPTENGIYIIEITTNQGCTFNILSSEVILSNSIPISISGPPEICYGSNAILSIGSNNAENIIWSNEAGVIATDTTQVTVSPNAPTTTYFVETLDNQMCAQYDTFQITVHEQPVVEIVGALSICPGQNTTIEVVNPMNDWTFMWLNESQSLISMDSFVIIQDSGIYQVIVTNDFYCKDSLTFSIQQQDDIAFSIIGNDFCDDSGTILDAGPGYDAYSWMDGIGMAIGDMQQLEITEAGLYIAEVSIGMCSGIDSIEIFQFESPSIEIVNTIDICNGTNQSPDTLIDLSSLVIASDGGNWTVLGGANIDLSDITSISFAGITAGNVTLVYTSNTAIDPCLNVSDSLIVSVSDCPCPTIDLRDTSLCNDIDIIDIDNQISGNPGPGTWSFFSGPEEPNLNGNNEITIDNLAPGSYLYIHILDDIPYDHCINSDTLEIIIEEKPILSLQQSAFVCNKPSPIAPNLLDLNSLILEGNGNWIDPMIPNLDFSDPSVLDFTNVPIGDYMISITTDSAVFPCSNFSMNIEITVLDCDCPPLALENPDPFCSDNATIDLNDYVGISADGNWAINPDNPEPTPFMGTTIILTGLMEGLYQYIYILDDPADECPINDTLDIFLFNPPQLTIIADTTVCNQNIGPFSTILNLNNLIISGSGEWTDHTGVIVSDPSSLDFVDQSAGSTFEFTFTTNSAVPPCSNISEILTVTVNDCNCDDPQFINPPDLCNVANESVDLNDLLTSTHNGIWEYIAGPIGSSGSITESTFNADNVLPGIYEFQFSITDDIPASCQKEWLLSVTVVNQLTAQIISSIDICTINEDGSQSIVNLSENIISGEENGIWYDSDQMIIPAPYTVDFLGQEVGIYEYIYSIPNQLPCNDVNLSLDINAIDCSTESEPDINVYFPNIFSPNEDGINDRFYPISNSEELTISNFSIFDRWGNNVFKIINLKPNNADSGWDGMYKNTFAIPGVYVYIVEYTLPNIPSIIVTGDVTLTR